METFACFILLSNVKLVYISLSLLVTSKAFNASGMPLKTQYLYIDSTIEYFGQEHLLYGILALTISFMFIFLPFLVLLLYPCRCFQKILNCLGWNYEVLRVFMDAFQGSYRHRQRYFSAYYLFLRYIILVITATVQSFFALALNAVVLVLTSFLVIFFQPQQSSTDNRLDMLALTVLTMASVITLFTISTFQLDIFWLSLANAITNVVWTFIVSYLVGVLIWVLFGYKLTSLYLKCKSRFARKREVHTELEYDGGRLSETENSPLLAH